MGHMSSKDCIHHTSKRNIPSTNGSNNSDFPLYSLSTIIVIRQLAGVNIESTPIRPSGFLRVFSSGTIAGGHFRLRTAPKPSGALQTRQESPQNPYVSHIYHEGCIMSTVHPFHPGDQCWRCLVSSKDFGFVTSAPKLCQACLRLKPSKHSR